MRPHHPFEEQLVRRWPLDQWADITVLLGVSGGADSVALLRAVHALHPPGVGRLLAAHFNHGLRGDDSQADQHFVESLCESLGIGCSVGRAPPRVCAAGDGLEAAARAQRYEFFQRTAETAGARYVVTAHTADDQAETILHHILRGTGLAGLGGMKRWRALGPAATLVRPMLDVSHADVLRYLASLDQPYREDKTNLDGQFTRNRIRHELLPLLARDYSPTVVDSLLRLGALASDAQRVIDDATAQLAERAIEIRDATRAVLDCRELVSQDRHLVRELLISVWRRQAWPLQAMGYSQWDLLADMALSPAQRDARQQVFPGAIRARRDGELFELAVDGW